MLADGVRGSGKAPSGSLPAETDSLIRLALAALAERHRPGVTLGNPEDTRAYLRLMLGDRRNSAATHGARRGAASTAFRRITSVQALTVTAPRVRDIADRTDVHDAAGAWFLPI